jgi:DNA-binding transcriptional regulator of glucitol operon
MMWSSASLIIAFVHSPKTYATHPGSLQQLRSSPEIVSSTSPITQSATMRMPATTMSDKGNQHSPNHPNSDTARRNDVQMM